MVRGAARGMILAALALQPLACDASDGPDVEARRASLEQQRLQLMTQFADAQNRVRNTQTQAMEHPSVAALRERFYDLLREEMIEIDPRAEVWLERAKELGARIDDLSGPRIVVPGQELPDTVDRGAVMREFAELERTLQPVQNRALADPEVAAAFAAVQDSVHALMARINPAAEASLEQMRRTSVAVDSIEAELRRLEE